MIDTDDRWNLVTHWILPTSVLRVGVERDRFQGEQKLRSHSSHMTKLKNINDAIIWLQTTSQIR